MLTNRHRRRRPIAVATSVAGLALAAGLLTACDDTTDNSWGCLSNLGTIAGSLKAIHEAGLDAAKDPDRTDESIDTINKNLDKIGDRTDDSKVNKAVDRLDKEIRDYNKAILNGDTDPDPSGINDAADALGNVCTS
jgi:hypothetical protein